METNRRKREPVRLGTHGENYGNWMSAPVFYMVGALIVLMAALCVISHFIPGMDPIGVLALVVAAAVLILLGWLLLDAMAGGFRAGAGSPLAGMERPLAGAGSTRAVTSAAAGRPSAVLPTENGRLSRALPAAAALFCLAAGICFLPGQAERTRAESLRRQQVNAVNLAALSYYEDHGELLYLADVMSTVDFSEKLFSEKSRPGNYDLLGGWLCKSPHSEKKLAVFGYESMGQAVSEGENVRFAGEPETDWSWLTALLAEQGKNAVLTLEEEITAEGRSLYIWRLERNL